MDPSARFWNKTAQRYAAQPIKNAAVYEKKLAITRAYLRPDMQVLEFGCGTGSTAIAHAPHVNHIHAIDFSSEMIRIAQEKARAADVQNATFETATLDDLAARNGRYGAILGLNVLHLIPDRAGAIRTVYRLLETGGAFVSSSVCLTGAWKLIAWLGPIGRALGLMPQLRAMSTDDLKRDLTAAGFEIDHEWEPGVFHSIFIVAKKPA